MTGTPIGPHAAAQAEALVSASARWRDLSRDGRKALVAAIATDLQKDEDTAVAQRAAIEDWPSHLM